MSHPGVFRCRKCFFCHFCINIIQTSYCIWHHDYRKWKRNFVGRRSDLAVWSCGHLPWFTAGRHVVFSFSQQTRLHDQSACHSQTPGRLHQNTHHWYACDSLITFIPRQLSSACPCSVALRSYCRIRLDIRQESAYLRRHRSICDTWCL